MAKKETKAPEVEPKETKAPEVDIFAKGAGLFLDMPTGHTRAFEAKAKQFGIKGRTDGPCSCLVKFQLPNGDIILAGDTFDPVEERMSAGEYKSLLGRKYFETDRDQIVKVETKLLEIAVKK